MKNILLADELHPAALQQLQNLSDVRIEVIAPFEEPVDIPEKLLKNAHILFSTVPPSNLDEATNLELIQIGSVGFSQLYDLNLPARGIRACNARGVFDPTIAEWNIAMMINLLRDLRSMIRHQEHGIWDRHPRFQRELRGLTVGIWGYGGIGRATARLAKALGMKVHVLARNGVGQRESTYLVPETGDPEGTLPDRVFTHDEKTAFLSGLDFLVLSVPQTPQTTGMIGEAELKSLPPSSFVLNPARGPLIQEAALLRALREGWIAGAALDTHYYYPMPADHPLWRFPNVILTPHISGSDSSPHFRERISDILLQNVQRLLVGEPLLNEISPSELKSQ